MCIELKKILSLLILCLHCGRHLKQSVVIMLPVKQLEKITSQCEREREGEGERARERDRVDRTCAGPSSIDTRLITRAD